MSFFANVGQTTKFTTFLLQAGQINEVLESFMCNKRENTIEVSLIKAKFVKS